MIKYIFTKWGRGAGKPIMDDEISIKRSYIALNTKLAKKLFPTNRVELFFDKDNKIIGLKRSIYKGDFKVIDNGSSTGSQKINAKLMLKYLDVRPKRYNFEWGAETNMMIICYESNAQMSCNKRDTEKEL